MTPRATKAALRAEALARRDRIDPAFRIEASLAVADLFPLDRLPVAGKTVAGFLPIRSEIDARPLMARLREAGARLALPAFAAKDAPMTFRVFARGGDLVATGFGTYGPGPEAETVHPDMVICPLAAFDRTGARIGYGKGHYDRALTELHNIQKISVLGLAFSVQEVDVIPAEPHDRALDGILTETGYRAF